MNVSVIIPAHNAADTLSAALDSLGAQSHLDWEAIVVDDGSGDATAAIAQRHAAGDARIRLIRQPRAGEGAARNTGIAAARCEALLFLDADDWLGARALERLSAALVADPEADVAWCRFERVTPADRRIAETSMPRPDAMFATLARYCPFAIHSCLVRREVLARVGSFDENLRTCADWDLWQRVARSGARFVPVPEVLAYYRIRPGSAGQQAMQLVTNGLRQVALGHAPDPRLPRPDPAYARGESAESLADAQLHFLCWPAGLRIGAGEEGTSVLDAAPDTNVPGLSANQAADTLFRAIAIGAGRAFDEMPELWPRIESRVGRFAAALAARAAAPGFARRMSDALEELVVGWAAASGPATIGRTQACVVDVTRPFVDVFTEPEVERLLLRVSAAETPLGTLLLPAIDGCVRADVAADAIADRYSWTILGRFFEAGIYRDLRTRQQRGTRLLFRGSVPLGPALEDGADFRTLHDHIGWTLFLQELWGAPDQRLADFYDPGARRVRRRRGVTIACEPGDWIELEVAHAPPRIRCRRVANGTPEPIHVIVAIGGARVTTLELSGPDLDSARLRATITGVVGLELCRVAVREGLLGRPLDPAVPLRERLRNAAAAPALPQPHAVVAGGAGIEFAPGSDRAIARALPQNVGVVLARRAGMVGTSVSRRASLPSGALDALREAAAAAGEPLLDLPGRGVRPVVYAPELLWLHTERPQPEGDRDAVPDASAAPARPYDRHHFERMFAERQDPWSYATPYETLKYEQTLEMVPADRPARALELACAEGRFTALLAPRVGRLVASDISEVALNRARERCAAHDNVEYVRMDLLKDPLPGRFDLIVCSEVLYYLPDRDALARIARKLAEGLEPGGCLIAAHTNVRVDDPGETGLDWDVPFGARGIAAILGQEPALELVREARSERYRILRFRRRPDGQAQSPEQEPVVERIPSVAPPPHVAARFRSGGARVALKAPPDSRTWRLPILMYHRISPGGSQHNARYRVSPERFEEQLRYLVDAGFRPAGFDEWEKAARRREPLPGRAVILTFDDGDRDFAEFAAPLLLRYGLGAMVFLVTDRVGSQSDWTMPWGEALPLMDWPTIRDLERQGIEFGAHTATHPYLTAVPALDAVRELASSRAALLRELQSPVPAMAYPFGAENAAVQHLAGACGFVYGLSCRPGPAGFDDPLLALPRIEITAADSLGVFIRKLSD